MEDNSTSAMGREEWDVLTVIGAADGMPAREIAEHVEALGGTRAARYRLGKIPDAFLLEERVDEGYTHNTILYTLSSAGEDALANHRVESSTSTIADLVARLDRIEQRGEDGGDDNIREEVDGLREDLADLRDEMDRRTIKNRRRTESLIWYLMQTHDMMTIDWHGDIPEERQQYIEQEYLNDWTLNVGN